MAGLVDIHAHILPGIDDGPDTIEESLDMARAAVASGIAVLAATPHLRSDFPNVHVQEIAARCETVQRALDQDGIPLRVFSGAEASLLWALEAGEEELRLASYGGRGTDLLIETPFDVSVPDRTLFALRDRGFRIILAHPERSVLFQRNPGPLARLSEAGVLLQVNAGALLHRRTPPGRLAEHLVREGLAHVIASDGHRGDAWRPVTALARGLEAVERLIGPERAAWMASAAPGAIVNGDPLPPAPPVGEPPSRRAWFRRLSVR